MESVSKAKELLEQGGEVLKFRECKLGSKELRLIALELEKHRDQVKELDFGLNQIKDDGVVAVSERFLTHNNSIKKVEFSSNHLQDQSAEAIGNGLNGNTSCEILCLAGNDIGDFGAISLFKSLLNHPSLKEIRLFYNKRISDGSIPAIVEFCRSSKTIEKIDLRWTAISPIGHEIIADAIANRGKIPIGRSSGKEISEQEEKEFTTTSTNTKVLDTVQVEEVKKHTPKLVPESPKSADPVLHQRHPRRLIAPSTASAASNGSKHNTTRRKIEDTVILYLGDFVEFCFHLFQGMMKDDNWKVAASIIFAIFLFAFGVAFFLKLIN